jgi:hypothetical protein
MIEHVIDNGGCQKRDRTTQKHEPRAPENAVKGTVIVCIRGYDARHEKYKAGEQIYQRRVYRDDSRGARTEMLGYDIHTHKGQPRDKYSPVERYPIELEQSFIGEKIHAHHAYRKERNDGCRDRPQKYFDFFIEFHICVYKAFHLLFILIIAHYFPLFNVFGLFFRNSLPRLLTRIFQNAIINLKNNFKKGEKL